MNKRKLLSKMAAQGYTQKMLAFDAGTSPNSISAYLNAKRPIPLDVVNAICQSLEIVDAQDKVDIFLS